MGWVPFREGRIPDFRCASNMQVEIVKNKLPVR